MVLDYSQNFEVYLRALLITFITMTVSNCFNRLIDRTGDPSSADGDLIIENYDRFDLSIFCYFDSFGMELQQWQVNLGELWEVHPDDVIEEFEKNVDGNLFVIVQPVTTGKEIDLKIGVIE